MKFIIKSLIVILLLLALSSCGAVRLSVKDNAKFTKNTTVTVAANDDQSGSVGELNQLLFEYGFNVVSYSTAKKAIQYKDEIKGSDPNNSRFEAEIYSVRELNSVYAIELDYTYYYDVFYYSYRSFSARVIDLNTGQIVASANFRGDRSVSGVLEDFAEQLAARIK